MKTIFVALSCVALCSCSHSTKTAYEDDKVKALHKDTVNYLNVHASHDEMWLVAFGNTYKDVRGVAPFYLEIPGKDLILFVTGRSYDNGQAIVHLINSKSKTEVHFPAYDSNVGKNIGRGEKIISMEGDKIITGYRETDRDFRFFLDLKEPKFEKEEAEYRNQPIGTTNHVVLVNGKSSYK